MTTVVVVNKRLKGIDFEVTPDNIKVVRNGKETNIKVEKGVYKHIEFPINKRSILAVVTRGYDLLSRSFSEIADIHWEMIYIDEQKATTFAEVIDKVDFN